jgi:hypothetical protein
MAKKIAVPNGKFEEKYSIMYNDQQMHNQLTNYHTPVLVFLFCLLSLLLLMLKYFGVSYLVLDILLKQMTAFVFGNFSLVLL